MKRKIGIACVILSALLILDSFNAGHAFVMFFLLGEIPGTRQVVEASVMLQMYVAISGFIAARVLIRMVAFAVTVPRLFPSSPVRTTNSRLV